jgi:hypothetical protein
VKKALDITINNRDMTDNNTLISSVLWPLTLLLSWVSTLDRSTITFALGTTVSLLAIAHYIVQIVKNAKSKNETK